MQCHMSVEEAMVHAVFYQQLKISYQVTVA
jgi:hypothetical protein